MRNTVIDGHLKMAPTGQLEEAGSHRALEAARRLKQLKLGNSNLGLIIIILLPGNCCITHILV